MHCICANQRSKEESCCTQVVVMFKCLQRKVVPPPLSSFTLNSGCRLLTCAKHCPTCCLVWCFLGFLSQLTLCKTTLDVLKGATKSNVYFICSCRSSSRPGRRSSAPMSRPSSPSWETAAPSTWGKVCAGGARRPRGGGVHWASHVTLVSFQCLTPTWRWRATRWRRASRGRHLGTCRPCSWLLVRSHFSRRRRDHRLGTTQTTVKRFHLPSSSSSVKCARSVPAYFAETLYYAMKVKWNPSPSQT